MLVGMHSAFPSVSPSRTRPWEAACAGKLTPLQSLSAVPSCAKHGLCSTVPPSPPVPLRIRLARPPFPLFSSQECHRTAAKHHCRVTESWSRTEGGDISRSLLAAAGGMEGTLNPPMKLYLRRRSRWNSALIDPIKPGKCLRWGFEEVSCLLLINHRQESRSLPLP